MAGSAPAVVNQLYIRCLAELVRSMGRRYEHQFSRGILRFAELAPRFAGFNRRFAELLAGRAALAMQIAVRWIVELLVECRLRAVHLQKFA